MAIKSSKKVLCKTPKDNELAIDNEIANGIMSTGKVELVMQGQIIDSPFDIEDYESENMKQVIAALGVSNRQEDLLYVKFKLVHANTNKNKDAFTKEELKKAEKTPILKLLNWQHKEPNIGVIYNSKYIESKTQEPDYIECIAAISKYKYKEYAKQIADRHNENNLFFSMETWFKEAQCSVCNNTFTSGESSYCDHLKNRYSESNTSSRILRGLCFAGAAVVDNPADELADSLAIAAKNAEKVENLIIAKEAEIVEKFTQEQVDEMIRNAVAEATEQFNTEKSGFETRITELETKLTELEGTLTQANTDFESKFNSLAEEYENYKKDVISINTASLRVLELATIGYDVPDRLANEAGYTELLNKVKVMDETSFNILKELVASKLEKKEVAENKETTTEDKAEASTKEEDNIPITVIAGNDNVTPLDKAKSAIANLLK
jgi:hypothetical protein